VEKRLGFNDLINGAEMGEWPMALKGSFPNQPSDCAVAFV
jgi:hypothetical protein